MTYHRVSFNAGACAAQPFIAQLERAGFHGLRLEGERVSFVVRCEGASLAPYAGAGELGRAGIYWAGVQVDEAPALPAWINEAGK